MDNLGEIVQKVQGLLQENNAQNVSEAANSDAPDTPALDLGGLGSMLGGLGSFGGGGDNDKTTLLHALRPHLSRRRLGRFDVALRIMQVGNVVGTIGPKNIGGIANLLSVLGGGKA